MFNIKKLLNNFKQNKTYKHEPITISLDISCAEELFVMFECLTNVDQDENEYYESVWRTNTTTRRKLMKLMMDRIRRELEIDHIKRIEHVKSTEKDFDTPKIAAKEGAIRHRLEIDGFDEKQINQVICALFKR